MSNRIELTIYPCRPLAAILSGGWFLLALAVTLAAVDTSLWLLLALPALAFSAWHSVSYHATLRSPRAIHALHVDRHKLSIETGAGFRQDVEVSSNSRLFGQLVLLKLRPTSSTKQAYTAILVALPWVCNVDTEAFRRLRVWLRFARDPHQDSPTSPL